MILVDISDLIGVKYKLHGRDKNGMDCYGFVLEVEKRMGKIMPDFDYSTLNDDFFSSKSTKEIDCSHAVLVDDFIEGALVLMHGTGDIKNHIGVYIGDGYIAHCDFRGVHLDKTEVLKHRIAGVYLWQK